MNKLMFRAISSILLFVLSVAAFGQTHSHTHESAHPLAEKIWREQLSSDLIFQKIKKAALFSSSELELLFPVFKEQYYRDYIQFSSLSTRKTESELWKYCDSMSTVYQQLFIAYSADKEKYMAEGEKILRLQNSLTPLEVNGPCANVDFEEGTTRGWTLTPGLACTNLYPCGGGSLGPRDYVIQSYGYDPIVGAGLPVVAPGGKYSLRIGDLEIGGRASSISQTFLVTPSNSNFTLQYAVVLEDPVQDHTDAERPYFAIRMTDGSGNSIPCAEYRVMAKPPITNFIQAAGGYYYRPWTVVAIPLNNYIGQNVTITFDVSDCVLLGHRAYAYIDGSCMNFEVLSDYESTCATAPVIMSGPEGYATYQWTGPGILGPANQQTVTANQPGSYNLSIAAVTGASCTASFNVNLTSPANTYAGEDTTICEGASVQLRATGVGTDAVWTPTTGLSDPNIPDPVATPATTTTYTITSCGVSDQVTVFVNPAFTISAPSDIKLCSDSVTQLSVIPSQPDNYTYEWRPNVGLNDAEISNPIATLRNPVQYTVYVTRESDGCVQEEEVRVLYNGIMPDYNLIAYPDKTCAGGEVYIGVVGKNVIDTCEVVDNSAFIVSGGTSNSVCGAVMGKAYFFDGSAERSATLTDWFLSTSRSGISFSLKVSTGNAPCENADAGEDIVVEYTIDDINWNVLGQLNQDQYPVFKPVTFLAPPSTMGVPLKFRIRQLTFSAAGEDTWMIDNIFVTEGVTVGSTDDDPSYHMNRVISWSPSTAVYEPNNISTLAYPEVTTTYTLTIQDLITQCVYEESVEIEVIPGFDMDMPELITICEGDTVSIEVEAEQPGAYMYSWFNTKYIKPVNDSSILAYPPVTTHYIVQVESVSGCVRKDTTTVEVNFFSGTYITADTLALCANQSIPLSLRHTALQEPIGYSWHWGLYRAEFSSACGSVSGDAITFNKADTIGFNGYETRELRLEIPVTFHAGMRIEFYLKISDGNGCDDAEPGDNVVLEYSTSGNTWNNLATFNESQYPDFTFISIPITGVAEGTNFRFRWRQLANSGTNQDVWALDNIVLTEPLTSPVATYTYQWTPAEGLDDNTSIAPVATPTEDTWYVVSVNTPDGCPDKDSVLITVSPDFLLSANDPVINTCINDVVTLEVQTDLEEGEYTAVWTPTTGLNDAHSLSPELTVTGNNVYHLEVDAEGCVKNLSFTVTPDGVASTVNVSVSEDTVCAGQTVTLNAKVIPAECGLTAMCEGTNENVYTVGAAGSSVPYPFSGSYRDGHTQILYTKAELLALGIMPGDLIKSISFEAVVKNSSLPYAAFTVRVGCTELDLLGNTFISGNTEVYTPKPVTTIMGWNELVFDYPYLWNGTSNLIIELCYDNSANSYHDYISSSLTTFFSATYAYTSAGTIAGCDLISGTAAKNRPVLRINTCAGSPDATYYSWSPSAGLSDPSSLNPTVLVNNTSMYTFTFGGNTSCPASESETIHTVSLVTDPIVDTTICFGTAAFLHTINDPDYQYSWAPVATLSNPTIYNPVAYPVDTTTYSVEISNGHCTGYDTVVVSVRSAIDVQIDADITSGQPPLLTNLNSHYTAHAYQWYTHTDPIAFSTLPQTSYTIMEPGDAIVYLEVTDNYGCRAIDSVYLTATYLFIPNLITPNGDGENDIFYLVLFGHHWDVKIYNRWNAKVYDNENYQNEWGAENVSDGVYYYYIKEKITQKEYKGWLHVIKTKN